MLQLTVQLLGVMERLGRKALEIEHKVRTGVELPALAAAELASKGGALGLYYTVPDYGSNEPALNRLLSQWLGSDVARLGCRMHAVEDPAKAALSTQKVLDGMIDRLSALAEADSIAVETLRPFALPTEAETFAGKPGEAGLKKATEVLKSTMGSTLGTYVEERVPLTGRRSTCTSSTRRRRCACMVGGRIYLRGLHRKLPPAPPCIVDEVLRVQRARRIR